jgi:hypothetical protein
MLEEKFQYQVAAQLAIFTPVNSSNEKCGCPDITPTSG